MFQESQTHNEVMVTFEATNDPEEFYVMGWQDLPKCCSMPNQMWVWGQHWCCAGKGFLDVGGYISVGGCQAMLVAGKYISFRCYTLMFPPAFLWSTTTQGCQT